jgi:hypothetical protein
MGPKHEEDQLSRPPGKRWSGNEHVVDDDEVSQAAPPLLLGLKEIHPTLNVLRLEGATHGKQWVSVVASAPGRWQRC